MIRTVRCEHKFAVQTKQDGTAPCLRERPHGDGAGAGEIRRRRQRKGRGWVDGVNSAAPGVRERPRRDGKGAGGVARGRAGRNSWRVRCQLLASNVRNGIMVTPHGLLGSRRKMICRLLPLQKDGAACRIGAGPHGDGEGAARGGSGRAWQDTGVYIYLARWLRCHQVLRLCVRRVQSGEHISQLRTASCLSDCGQKGLW